MSGSGRAAAACLLAIVLAQAIAAAHPLSFTETTLTLRADRTFEVDLVVDLDALALGASQTTDDAELVAALEAMSAEEFTEVVGRLATLFTRRVRVRFDDRPVDFAVSFPDHGTPRATDAEIPTILGLTARLTGTVPEGVSEVEFFASRAFSDVHLTLVDEMRGVTTRSVLERGARSDPYELAGPAAAPSRRAVALQYLRLGFAHIIPRGLDHILFVLGLFLFSTRLGPLVTQVTAFTVAHASTLALATLDVMTLSPGIVEPLIAVSIVWIALENIRRSPGAGRNPGRAAVVFMFGLLHGLGFAGVLRELGLPTGERLLGLVAFNVGIELGQLTVIAGAFCLLGWCRGRPWYRRRVVTPASMAIAVTGVVWTVDRLLG